MEQQNGVKVAESKPPSVNSELLAAAIRFNAVTLGIVTGLVGAITLYVATIVSYTMWGDNAGTYLGLLAVFLPGYSVSLAGAFFGSIWVFLFVGLSGFLTYWLYGRLLSARLVEEVESEAEDLIFRPTTLRLYGTPLGVAMGSAVGVALFVSTLWLVIRGTAHESYNAALLSNYLPGYSVSLGGAFIGALELVIVVFCACSLMAFVYNRVVDIRSRKTDSNEQ